MKTIYYSDPLHDDFANNGIKSKPLTENYKYIPGNPLRRSFDFLFYHCIAVPIVFVYQKVRFREKIVNRSALLPYLLSGFYLFHSFCKIYNKIHRNKSYYSAQQL